MNQEGLSRIILDAALMNFGRDVDVLKRTVLGAVLVTPRQRRIGSPNFLEKF